MRKINAAETEFAKVCLKKDGHVNMHAREHVFVNDSRNGNEIRIHAFVVSGSKKWTRITDNRQLIRGLLVKPDGRYYHFIQSRIEQARCRTRKDSTRFVDTLITSLLCYLFLRFCVYALAYILKI